MPENQVRKAVFGRATGARLFVQDHFPGADGFMSGHFTDNDFYRVFNEYQPNKFHVVEVMITSGRQVVWVWFCDGSRCDDQRRKELATVQADEATREILDQWKALWWALSFGKDTDCVMKAKNLHPEVRIEKLESNMIRGGTEFLRVWQLEF